mgnify:CR=1 FL=1
MTVNTGAISPHRQAACLVEVSACIAEAEASTSAQAFTLTLLAITGFDTSEAMQGLWDDMDALAVLRDVHHYLRG